MGLRVAPASRLAGARDGHEQDHLDPPKRRPGAADLEVDALLTASLDVRRHSGTLAQSTDPALEPVDPPVKEDVVDKRAKALAARFGTIRDAAAADGTQPDHEDESTDKNRDPPPDRHASPSTRSGCINEHWPTPGSALAADTGSDG